MRVRAASFCLLFLLGGLAPEAGESSASLVVQGTVQVKTQGDAVVAVSIVTAGRSVPVRLDAMARKVAVLRDKTVRVSGAWQGEGQKRQFAVTSVREVEEEEE